MPPDDDGSANLSTGARVPLACALAAGVVYALGLQTGVGWGDSAGLATDALTLDVSVDARGYPLQQVLTWLLGRVVGDAALAANLFSLLASATAVGLLARVVARLGGGAFAAVVGCGVMGLGHTFWTHATVAEVYALHDVFVLVAILGALCMRRTGSAVLLGVTCGLALLHHRMFLLLVPVFLVWAVFGLPRGDRVRGALRLLGWSVVGALPFLVLALSSVPETGGFGDWLRRALFGGSAAPGWIASEGGAGLVDSGWRMAKWLLFNLPGPALVLCTVVRFRRGIAALSTGLLAMTFSFAVLYDGVGDQHVFLSSAYPVLGVLAALGTQQLLDVERRRRLGWVLGIGALLAPPLTYGTLAVSSLGERLLPVYEPSTLRRYVLPLGQPGLDAAAACSRAIDAVPPGASLHADWGSYSVLRYLRQSAGHGRGVLLRKGLLSDAQVGDWVLSGPYWRDPAAALGPLRDRVEPQAERGLFRVVR